MEKLILWDSIYPPTSHHIYAQSTEEKDLGIPSKFPFKDQILAEAAELKVKVSLRN